MPETSPSTVTAASATERRDATEDEIRQLRHVPDTLPTIAWVALLVGSAERFTYYAVTAPWQNYIQNPAGSVDVPGALGLGQATATNISNAFSFFSFLSPLPFAILSDTRLGRYKTLCISFMLNLCGCIVLFVTSLPQITDTTTKTAGLGVAMLLLGLGTGGIKAAATPFIGDQYDVAKPQVFTTRRGERVVTDRTLTVQYIYNLFYWFTNLASLSLIASTYLEKSVGFWAAFLLPLCSFLGAFPMLIIWRKSFVKLEPQGNVLPQAAKVIAYSAQSHFRLDQARPLVQQEKYGRQVSWSDHFVFEISVGLKACKVMACFVPFYLCMNQISNNLISQAAQTQLDGIPNDAVQAFSPVACVLLGPIIQKGLYPALQKRNIQFGPIVRMSWAFVVMGAAMAFAAGIQALIYSRGPCFQAPLACAASNGGSIPNSVSVWVQLPVYFLIAFAEILGFVTLSEYSYSQAPKDMRTLVQALRQISAGLGSALGMATSLVAVDPKILYLYISLAAVMVASAPIFWLTFRSYDRADTKLADSESINASRASVGDEKKVGPTG